MVSAQNATDINRFIALANSDDDNDDASLAASDIAWSAVENAHYLSEEALRGFVIFLSIAKVSPDRARELLEDDECQKSTSTPE